MILRSGSVMSMTSRKTRLIRIFSLTSPSRNHDCFPQAVFTCVFVPHSEDPVGDHKDYVDFPKCAVDEKAVDNACEYK